MKTLIKSIISAVLFLGLQSQTFATDEQEEIELTQQIKAGFSELPVELQEYIFSFLEQKDFHRASLVCRGWREAAFIAGEKKTLDLSGRKVGTEGCHALLRVPFSSVSLQKCRLEETEVFMLSRLTRIKGLNLKSNIMGPVGASILASGNLVALTTLGLQDTGMGDGGAIIIASGNLTALTMLDLGNNRIGDAGAQGLAGGNLTALTMLDLGNNSIRDKGVKALASGNLTSLRSLNLNRNSSIGDEGA